jgi:Flp pilus assembly protein TadG
MRRWRQRRPPLRGIRSGNASIEFALILPLFITCIVGVMEVGRILWIQNNLQRAVEVAARCASIDKTNCATSSDVINFATSEAAGLTVPSGTFATSTPACGNQVTASLAYDYMTSFLPMPALTLTASACFPK